MWSADSGRPFESTSRMPRRQPSRRSASGSATGPSEAIGAISAAPIAPPVPSAATFKRRLRVNRELDLLDELLDLLDLCDVRLVRVRLADLLNRHEQARDHDACGRREREAEPERQAEQLRGGGQPVDRVHRNEAGEAQRGQREQGEHRVLAAARRRLLGDQALPFDLRGRAAAQTPEQERDERPHPLHRLIPSPITRASASNAMPAINHATIPSGNGPEQADRPAAAVIRVVGVEHVADERVELARRDACLSKRGITYGPTRTASAICVAVADFKRRDARAADDAALPGHLVAARTVLGEDLRGRSRGSPAPDEAAGRAARRARR